jgi:hypothetical protein
LTANASGVVNGPSSINDSTANAAPLDALVAAQWLFWLHFACCYCGACRRLLDVAAAGKEKQWPEELLQHRLLNEVKALPQVGAGVHMGSAAVVLDYSCPRA